MKPDSRKDRRFAVQLPSVFREGEQMDQATVLNLSLQGCALTAERLPKAAVLPVIAGGHAERDRARPDRISSGSLGIGISMRGGVYSNGTGDDDSPPLIRRLTGEDPLESRRLLQVEN